MDENALNDLILEIEESAKFVTTHSQHNEYTHGYAEGMRSALYRIKCAVRSLKVSKPRRSKWHKVEDKVVEAGKVYLVRYIGFVENARCTAYRNCAGIWYSDPGGVILKEVTHWRELPKFKEERDA